MEYKILRSRVDFDTLEVYSSFFLSAITKLNYTDVSRTTQKYLKWQYIDNPNGQVIGYDAFYEDSLVSHFALIPVIYSISGSIEKCLLALNLVTHPLHRGKGLFLKIATKALEDASNLGYKYVFGVANQNSSHGLVNRLGFNLITALDVKIGFGTVTMGNRKNYEVYPIWSKQSLSWRLQNPSAKYFRCKKGYITAPTGKYNIYAQMHNYQDQNGIIMNISEKNPLINLWIGLACRGQKRGMLFDLPNKLRPVPLNLICKSLTGSMINFEKEDIGFELIDFDAY